MIQIILQRWSMELLIHNEVAQLLCYSYFISALFQ